MGVKTNPGSPTPHKDVNDLLVDWVDGVRRILSGNVVGLYLFGSLTYGDFVRGRSDIDLQAVVRQPLDNDELSSIEKFHFELERRHAAWAGRVECSYLPAALLPETLPPMSPRPWWGFSTLYRAAPYGNEWIINQYLLERCGVALAGPEFRTLLERPVDVMQVREASARDLLREWEPKIDDPEWLAVSHYQSYLVLNLCRILVTVVGGDVASKSRAAAWVVTTYPEWKDLVTEAMLWRHGMEMKRQNEAIAFVRFAIQKVNETIS